MSLRLLERCHEFVTRLGVDNRKHMIKLHFFNRMAEKKFSYHPLLSCMGKQCINQ